MSESPRVLRNFVAGEYRSAGTDWTSDIVDPSTGQVVAQAPVSSAADVDAAYSAAETAFESWGETTPSERQLALLKFADAWSPGPRNWSRWRHRTPASRSR